MSGDNDQANDRVEDTIQPEAPSYHPGYNDPSADMVIQCEDHVRLRVHSYILKAHSLYFRHMPDDTAELTGDSERIVELPVESSGFISLLRVIERIPAQYYEPWDTMKEVLDIGARYEFFAVPSFILQGAHRALNPVTAWPIFVFAAKQDCFPLAKVAVSHLVGHNVICYASYENFPLHFLAELPGNYGGALIRAMAKHPGGGGQWVQKWEKISGSFTL